MMESEGRGDIGRGVGRERGATRDEKDRDRRRSRDGDLGTMSTEGVTTGMNAAGTDARASGRQIVRESDTGGGGVGLLMRDLIGGGISMGHQTFIKGVLGIPSSFSPRRSGNKMR
jgi:hypothetical protein